MPSPSSCATRSRRRKPQNETRLISKLHADEIRLTVRFDPSSVVTLATLMQVYQVYAGRPVSQSLLFRRLMLLAARHITNIATLKPEDQKEAIKAERALLESWAR
jgi:hypothetical protein